MSSCNKIIVLILLTICSLNVHLNNGFKFPIYDQQNDIRTPQEIGSINQLEIDRLNDDIRMKKVAQQRFQLGPTVMPQIFESNYKPFIELATRLPHIIRLFNDDNPMITDDMSETDINDIIDFTTVEEANKDFNNEKQKGNATTIKDQLTNNITDITVSINTTTKTEPPSFTTTTTTMTTTTTNGSSSASASAIASSSASTSATASSSVIAIANNSAIAIASDSDVPPLPGIRYNFSDKDAARQAVAAKATPWPITDNEGWSNTFFFMNSPQPEMTLQEVIAKNYHPITKFRDFPTICRGRTTLLNKLKVWDYNPYRTAITSSTYLRYNLDIKLRRQIYEKGVSEKCHDPNATDFTEYIKCAILRNMRMESVHPTFPKIQLEP